MVMRDLCSAEQTFTLAAECWTLSRYTLSQVLRAATIPDPGALRPVSSDVAVKSEVHITQFQYTIVNLGGLIRRVRKKS